MNGLKPAAARDFIQMIGNAFPVNQIVLQNTHKSVTNKCHLCRKAIEMYLHMQMGCIKTKDVRTRIHNMILEELLKAIKTKRPTAEIDRKPKIGDYCPCEDAHLASFEPDAIVRWLDEEGVERMIVVEVTRCLTEVPGEHKTLINRK